MTIKPAGAAIRKAAFGFLRVVAGILASPFSYIFGLSIGGASTVVSGVYELAGYGPAAIAAGAFMLCAAAFITKGLKPNG